MRFLAFLLMAVCAISSALGAETEWYVVVYGENFQTITGASTSESIEDGQFLGDEFVGHEIFVRSAEYYELDQFRPADSSATGSTQAAMISSDASSASEVDSPAPGTEFGPLPDTGLTYVMDGDFRGWTCPELYVTPLGERVYRLRCDQEMRLE